MISLIYLSDLYWGKEPFYYPLFISGGSWPPLDQVSGYIPFSVCYLYRLSSCPALIISVAAITYAAPP